MALSELLGAGAIAGFMGAFFMFFLAIYVYAAFALMTIAKKTGTEPAWLAWVPVVNIYLLVKIAQQPWWQVFAIALTFIPFVGQFAFMAVMVFWWWKIAEARGKQGWLSILMLIPLVNLGVLGYLAWSE
jgi:hypothetical protein